MRVSTMVSDQSRAVWRTRLGSAFRTALACTIIGCSTLYGPAPLRSELAFPAFSYVTAILIVSDATLGDTLRGCWHAFYATVQVIPLSMLSFWIMRPGRFATAGAGGAALAVAVGTFLVALPERTHLMTKRIAFGQLVIVYVGAVIHGNRAGAVMHPLHVALSTALGALASVVALVFPYRRLAIFEVRKLSQLYAENASERASLFVKAFLAQNNLTATELISQTKPFAETGAKLLQTIKLVQEGVMWEKPRMRSSKHRFINPGERLQDMETPIRGMEIALTSSPSFPVSMMDQEFSNVLLGLEVKLGLKLEQAKCFLPFDSMTPPGTKGEFLDKSLDCISTISPTQKDLPAFFFLTCVQLLIDSTVTENPESFLDDNQIPNIEETRDTKAQDRFSFKRICDRLNVTPSKGRLVFAFKCSLSLGLAVLFGVMFNKYNGYWSGLTIAISFVTGRQPTFTASNARAQGTAIGSVYGVLGSYVFQSFTEMRFLLLLPWIIFASFLRHSRMYGQPGGISAVIGALLILGRKNYGPTDDFATARLTEASIGLFCMIMVEIFLQPARAATLAKVQLSQSLGTLQECIQQIVLFFRQKEMSALFFLALREQQRKLKSHVNDLEKFSRNAELEPDFWFLPFRASCYNKLQGSLSKMVDLLHFMAYLLEFLLQVSTGFGVAWKEIEEHMDKDLQLFKEIISSSLKYLEKITSIESLAAFQKDLQEAKIFHDLESGTSPNTNIVSVTAACEEAAEKILSSFLQHIEEVTKKIGANEAEEDLKVKAILCLSSLAFCISGLMRETNEIEKGVKELVQWENPSSHINFHEISCKLDAMYPK